MKKKTKKIIRRVIGSDIRPRVAVFKSNKHLYVQIIDDAAQKTILGVHDKEITHNEKGKIELAKKLGVLLAEKAKKLKIDTVVFDRRNYAYHGVIKSLADGAREGGLKF